MVIRRWDRQTKLHRAMFDSTFPPDFTRRCLVYGTELVVESPDAAETRVLRHLGHANAGIVDEPPGELHTHRTGNCQRCTSQLLLKQPVDLSHPKPDNRRKSRS